MERAVPQANSATTDQRVDRLAEAGHENLGLFGGEEATLKVPATRLDGREVELDTARASGGSRSALGESMLRLVEEAGVVVKCESRLAHISRKPTPLLGKENVSAIHGGEKALDVGVDDKQKVREEVCVVEHEAAAQGGATRGNTGRPTKVARQPSHDRRVRRCIEARLKLE